jgi:hypothetical protein
LGKGDGSSWALLRTVRSLEMLAGFCYTQFTDTYQETSGLLFADRTPKFPLEEIESATCGRGPAPPAGPRGPLATDGDAGTEVSGAPATRSGPGPESFP